MFPTVGRIVLVKCPEFHGECAAIVTEAKGAIISAQVFRNDHFGPMFLPGLSPQREGAKWGWRWLPEDTDGTNQIEHAPAVATEEQLARV